jgi:hypothetical protein
MKFETDGEYRIERRRDGLYVVGGGMLCSVSDREEGDELIADLTRFNLAAASAVDAIRGMQA